MIKSAETRATVGATQDKRVGLATESDGRIFDVPLVFLTGVGADSATALTSRCRRESLLPCCWRLKRATRMTRERFPVRGVRMQWCGIPTLEWVNRPSLSGFQNDDEKRQKDGQPARSARRLCGPPLSLRKICCYLSLCLARVAPFGGFFLAGDPFRQPSRLHGWIGGRTVSTIKDYCSLPLNVTAVVMDSHVPECLPASAFSPGRAESPSAVSTKARCAALATGLGGNGCCGSPHTSPAASWLLCNHNRQPASSSSQCRPQRAASSGA